MRPGRVRPLAPTPTMPHRLLALVLLALTAPAAEEILRDVGTVAGLEFVHFNGITGEPAKAEQVASAAMLARTNDRDGGQRAIQEKLPRLQQLMRSGRASPQTIGPMMREFQDRMREQRYEEASRQLDLILEKLEAAPAQPN